MKWIEDEELIRGKVPMTKKEVRILTLANYDIEPGFRFLDIGAGTGSISLQAAAMGAEVTAIEVNGEGVELIEENAKNLGLKLRVIEGKAPQELPDETFDGIFIGGSKGTLRELVAYAKDHLSPGGRLVGNFVTMKNGAKFKEELEENFSQISLSVITVANEDWLGILRGQNPIFMIGGTLSAPRDTEDKE
ncbi:MAG: precorrin-6Y C5,15-methyltransferase (decarboxylating) subunit CbiT [Tissierellia bacterium]|nr:precorrin-6Y C5,15-methyltransferase (decarboxylating) subunit CbiT [Tissierellia bacterium]